MFFAERLVDALLTAVAFVRTQVCVIPVPRLATGATRRVVACVGVLEGR